MNSTLGSVVLLAMFSSRGGPLVRQVGDPSILSITPLSIISIFNFAAMLIDSQKHQLHHHIHPLLIHSQKNKPHHHIPPSY